MTNAAAIILPDPSLSMHSTMHLPSAQSACHLLWLVSRTVITKTPILWLQLQGHVVLVQSLHGTIWDLHVRRQHHLVLGKAHV